MVFNAFLFCLTLSLREKLTTEPQVQRLSTCKTLASLLDIL